MGLAHAEHLDDTLIGSVDTVLRASVALGYPYRLFLLLDGIADVFRQVERFSVEFLQIAAWALYAEHLITLAYIDHDRIHHEVGTEGDLCGLEAVNHKEIL